MTAQLNPMTASISFQGNIACGGSASLVLKEDGTCVFHGGFHDSGFVPYGVAFALVVSTKTGKAFSFKKQGSVNGTIDILADATKSRDFTWDDTTVDPNIAKAWPELAAGSDYHWKADVNVDVMNVLQSVVGIVKAAGPIVGTVIAII